MTEVSGIISIPLTCHHELVLTHPSIHPSIYGATAPSGPWPPLEDTSILLCLLLVSSILVFLVSVMCHSGQHPPILFLVFPLVLYYEISH